MIERSTVAARGLMAFAVTLISLSVTGCEGAGSAGTDQVSKHITVATFGCQSLDTANQIGKLIGEHDKAAELELTQRAFATGDCANLDAGQEVYIEESHSTGLVKVRPKGHSVTYWTVSNVVGP